MTKPFPPILLAAATVLFFSRPRRFAAAQATLEQQNDVELILERMEDEAKAFRDEIERVYTSRCDSETLNECVKKNYNDCWSKFPNEKCVEPDEFVMSDCGDGYSCNGETVRSEFYHIRSF
jgi:hypothetical protein